MRYSVSAAKLPSPAELVVEDVAEKVLVHLHTGPRISWILHESWGGGQIDLQQRPKGPPDLPAQPAV